LKFIHAADVHLDSPLRGLERYEGAPVEEIRSATRRAFDNLIELAIEEEVSCVLLAGDLYDGDWKDYNTGLFFVDRMRRLESAGIRVFLVAGNHDAASQITRQLRLPENVTRFSDKSPETVVLEELGLAVHGQSFANREVREDLSDAYPPADPHLFNIGILHTCLDGKPGHEPYAPCTVDGLRSKGYQYWALGHIHNREVVSRDPWIIFPGNIQGRHARELGPKGCTLVTIDDGEVGAVEHRYLDVLRWARCVVDVTDSATVDEIYEQVRGALRQVLEESDGRPVAARLILQGSSRVHSTLRTDSDHWIQEYRALASGLGGAGMWLEKVVVETRPAVAMDELLARDDALGELLQSIRALEIGAAETRGLAEEVAALRRKLPPELLFGTDGYDPGDPQYLTGVLEDVKELLMHRLLAKGGD
jgi:DNA repair exonuclease SbcCD nuclease subunit